MRTALVRRPRKTKTIPSRQVYQAARTVTVACRHLSVMAGAGRMGAKIADTSCAIVMAGRVPAICTSTVGGWMAGTRPAMTEKQWTGSPNPFPSAALS